MPKPIQALDPIDSELFPEFKPRGLRNNNPGNLRKTNISWQGETEGRDQAFETFATPEDGIRATAKNLLSYQKAHKLNTVEAIISKWAPQKENNTGAYVQAVSQKLGVNPWQRLDLDNEDTLTNLTAAIIEHENGMQPFDPDTLRQSVALARSPAAVKGDAIDQELFPTSPTVKPKTIQTVAETQPDSKP